MVIKIAKNKIPATAVLKITNCIDDIIAILLNTKSVLSNRQDATVSPGFEPRQRESKSLVLPLHHETKKYHG